MNFGRGLCSATGIDMRYRETRFLEETRFLNTRWQYLQIRLVGWVKAVDRESNTDHR